MNRYPSEHEEQSALVTWARSKGIELLVAIPNGGYRAMNEAKRLKREGVQPGFPDLFLAVPHKGYHGLFIEMKSMTGRASSLQKVWLSALEGQGYRAVICQGFEAAKKEIEEYLSP